MATRKKKVKKTKRPALKSRPKRISKKERERRAKISASVKKAIARKKKVAEAVAKKQETEKQRKKRLRVERKKRTEEINRTADKLKKEIGKKAAAAVKARMVAELNVPAEARKTTRLDALPDEFEAVNIEKLERVEAMLLDATERLRSAEVMKELGLILPLDVVMRSHANKDGSLDAEIRCRVFPPDVVIKEVLIAFENSMRYIPGTFISVGFESHHQNDFHRSPEIVVGSGRAQRVQAGTHYFRSNKMAIGFLTAEDKVYDSLIEKGFSQPDAVYVRLHWNPDGSAPGKDKRFKRL